MDQMQKKKEYVFKDLMLVVKRYEFACKVRIENKFVTLESGSKVAMRKH